MVGDREEIQMIVRDSTDQEVAKCPECNGPISPGTTLDETVCEECGLIVAEDRLDRSPEWRAFTHQEHQQKARVGAPTTPTMHDKGLSTQIGWQNKDANGQSLSPRKRKQLGRLRKWHKRCQTWDGKERNLKQAFSEIDRMASALGLPKSACETASVIYRRALSANLLLGRSIESVATATLYAAARTEGIPRTLDEMTSVARVEYNRIARAYRAVIAELELAIEPTDPIAYLPRFTSKLDCSQATHRKTRELLEGVVGRHYTSGKSPVGLAAAALYAGSCLTGDPLTQQEISDVANVTTMTIRTHYREFLNDE